jgi:hypothetical protein
MAETAVLLPALITAAGTAYGVSQMSKTPKASGPTRMPDPQSPEVMEARRRKLADQQAASGRESTILSDDTFSNDLLGQ